MLKMIDSFTLALIATVTLASLLPCQGEVAQAMNLITTLAIGLLFFLHGAKLSREAVIAGATHWKLHLTVMACTFVLFPALGLALKPLLGPLVTPELYLGVLYLCMLPSTVQSSIAFTSMAQGNIPAAICSVHRLQCSGDYRPVAANPATIAAGPAGGMRPAAGHPAGLDRLFQPQAGF